MDYAALQPGDVVQTVSFNSLYITKISKEGSDFQDRMKETCAPITAVFHAFDRDYPELF